jgi:acetyl-CoA synthetase
MNPRLVSSTSYEDACAAHRWQVPERYNIASDVCDKHSRDKLAMVWESFDGSYRELAWGELQDLANQAAQGAPRARGRARRPRGGRLPATPAT